MNHTAQSHGQKKHAEAHAAAGKLAKRPYIRQAGPCKEKWVHLPKCRRACCLKAPTAIFSLKLLSRRCWKHISAGKIVCRCWRPCLFARFLILPGATYGVDWTDACKSMCKARSRRPTLFIWGPRSGGRLFSLSQSSRAWS